MSSILASGWTLILTLVKTYRLRKEARELHVSVPLTSLLLRDGSIQFCGLTTLYILATISMYIEGGPPIGATVNTVSSILMSRFILGLREVYLHTNLRGQSSVSIRFPTSTRSHALQSIVFASPRGSSLASNLVGNLGAPLRIGEEDAGSPNEQSVISGDPLAVGVSEMITASTGARNSEQKSHTKEEGIYHERKPLVLESTLAEEPLAMDEVFEDPTYGRSLLDLIRRRGTGDSTQTKSSLHLPIDQENQHLTLSLEAGDSDDDSGSVEDAGRTRLGSF
ncbi:hypothetical protein EIP91_004086 [Steccherinum ochraceum]|uniref:Uncharacterized protein n=1 Tax=Steccherinum ochraceum TaxID=92696 RepID=A0A4R0R9F8_9APHY|nr:hypothetical protein EIP91_004086 [Steccherinum ochraceum]